MSVFAYTDDSAALHARIKNLIDLGHITTWAYDQDGDFTHTPAQWKNKAWFTPEERSDRLWLHLVANSDITREVFAVYQGRFIEMLISHVSNEYTSASATSDPASDEPLLQD